MTTRTEDARLRTIRRDLDHASRSLDGACDVDWVMHESLTPIIESDGPGADYARDMLAKADALVAELVADVNTIRASLGMGAL